MSENHPVLLGWRICLVISTLPLIYSDRIKKNVDYEVNINIFNCSANSLLSLERKEYTKYLCVLIYSKWSRSKSLSILSGLRNFVPQTVLLNLHLSLFKLTCPTGLQSEAKLPIQSSLEKVLIMQKRARAVPFVNFSNILPRHLIYFKTMCSFMHHLSTI